MLSAAFEQMRVRYPVAEAVTVGAILAALCGCRLTSGPECDAQPEGADAYVSCDCEECDLLYSLPSEHYLRCFDERVAIHEATHRANTAMRYDYNERPSADVRDGYRAAFVDVALGGSGEVPPVPPQRYWSTWYRTADGHRRAQAWFAGYATGASRALASCRQCYNTVPSSGRTSYEDDSTRGSIQKSMESFPSNHGW